MDIKILSLRVIAHFSFPIIKFSRRYAEYRNFMELPFLETEPYLIIEPSPRPWKCSKFPCGMVARGVEWLSLETCVHRPIPSNESRGSARSLVPTSRQFYTRRTTVLDGGMKDVCKFNRLGRWKILCIPERAARGTVPSSSFVFI